MNIWQELFGKIGWFVIPLMVVAWALREWWDVRKGATKVALSELAEKRAESIQSLYSELVKTEAMLRDFYYLHMPVGISPPKVEPRNAVQQFRLLQQLARSQRPLYPVRTCRLLDSMDRSLSDVALALERREVLIEAGGRGSDDEAESERDAFTGLTSVVPEIRADLEKDFRHLLGGR